MSIEFETWDDGKLLVNKDYVEFMRHNNITDAETLLKISSESVKNILKQRGTERAFLESVNGTTLVETYIKRYLPIPFKEKIKSLVSLKPYAFDGIHEWNALLKFHSLALPTMIPIAAGTSGESTFNLTVGITDYTRASDLFEKLKTDRLRRRKLIRSIAEMAGEMHAANCAHQDLYLVHIFVLENDDDAIRLIDLQRLIMQDKLSRRWRVKDLAQLLFSSAPLVTRSDILFFWKIYTGIAGKGLYKNRALLKSIISKAGRITKRHARKSAKK